MNDDTISRRAAIDALSVGKELLSRVLDDMDVVGTDREKYSWGLELIKESIKDIEELPPAQPEIIRCKDCKHYKQSEWLLSHMCCHYVIGSTVIRKSDDFCSRAERRTDAETEV